MKKVNPRELWEILNSCGELRAEIGGIEKYRKMTNEEIIFLMDAIESMETIHVIKAQLRKVA